MSKADNNVAAGRTPMRLPNGKIWRAGSTCSRPMGCSSTIRLVRLTVVAPSPTRSATTARRFPTCTASYITCMPMAMSLWCNWPCRAPTMARCSFPLASCLPRVSKWTHRVAMCSNSKTASQTLRLLPRGVDHLCSARRLEQPRRRFESLITQRSPTI